MKVLILAIIAFIGWGWWSGYRIHAENLPYYFKVDTSGAKQEITLSDGATVTGEVEDLGDVVRVNSEGIVMSYKKSQIASMKSAAAPDFISMMKSNYEKNKKLHPLLTKRQEDTMSAVWEKFTMEPSRLAEEMKKKNPGLSATEEINRQMAANAKARLDAYKNQQKMIQEAEAESKKNSSYFNR